MKQINSKNIKRFLLVLILIFIISGITPVNIKAVGDPPPEEIPYPPLDKDCISYWNFKWYFEECIYCDLTIPYGDYFLFSCTIMRNGYETIKYKSVCQYTSSITKELELTYLPIVSK